jgi:hypothetical protein
MKGIEEIILRIIWGDSEIDRNIIKNKLVKYKKVLIEKDIYHMRSLCIKRYRLKEKEKSSLWIGKK